jgi:drug/metabolite transporter (DMT)-like permease
MPASPTPARGSITGRDSLAVDLALFCVILMWASTFTLFKMAWHRIDPVAFTGLRFSAMVAFSLVVLGLSRNRVRLRRRDVPLVVASGLTGYFVYQLAFVLGLDRTSALASSILVATHPIFSVVFLWLAGRERPTRVEVLGVVVGFLGVAVFLRAWHAFAAASVGDLLSLLAAASFGAYGVVNRSLTRRYPSRELMAYGLAVGGLLVAVVGLPAVLRQDWGGVGFPAWIILVYATVGPVYVAYALWNWAISRRGVPRTVVWGFLTPVMAGALAVVGLGEHLRPEQAVGALLVVAGLVVTRLGARARAVPAPAPVVAASAVPAAPGSAAASMVPAPAPAE